MSDAIERKIVIAPIKRRPFLISLGIVIGLGFLGYLAFGVPFLFSWVLLGLPVWATGGFIVSAFMSKGVASDMTVKARGAFVGFIGHEPKHCDVLASPCKGKRGSVIGTGVAITDTHIFVMDDGEAARIPLSMVRDWTWKIAGYTTFDGEGVAGAQKALRKTTESRGSAYLESGLFISVKDVDKPTWQFMTDDKSRLERWNEILSQMFEKRVVGKSASAAADSQQM